MNTIEVVYQDKSRIVSLNRADQSLLNSTRKDDKLFVENIYFVMNKGFK